VSSDPQHAAPKVLPLPEDSTPEELSLQLDATVVLIERCRAGDAAATDELVARYYPRLLRVVRMEMFASLRNRVEPEEIADSALMTGLRKLPDFEYREEASLINWLSRIALNKLHDARRYHVAACRDVALEVCVEAFGDGREESVERFQFAARDTEPPERAAREEYREIVDRCVAELADDHREVVRLRVYEKGSLGYAASRLGRSEGATSMLFKRAIDALGERPEIRRLGGSTTA